MKVTRVVINEGDKSQIVVDDSYILDGVLSFTIHQDAGQPPKLLLQLEMVDVEIEQNV